MFWGIVSKCTASRYRRGPSKVWIKTTNVTESEFILLGLERDSEGRPFAHVGTENAHGLAYAGMAFMTFARERPASSPRTRNGLLLHRVPSPTFTGRIRPGLDPSSG